LLKALKKEYRFIETGNNYNNLKSILNNLVSRLAKPKGFNYKIFLLDDSTLNAVTLGGHIFFNKGMFDFCKTNSEIAAIISHEIAHNELGHSTLAMKKQKAANDWGVLGEIFLEIESVTTLSFNQKQESEADLFGMDLVYPTNFKNCDAITLWNRMSQNESRFDIVENFFRSHPYSKNRSRCIKNHLKSNYNKNCY
jgi:predicted Zn-dependent protease